MRGQCKMEERASSHCGSGLLSVIVSACSVDIFGGKSSEGRSTGTTSRVKSVGYL